MKVILRCLMFAAALSLLIAIVYAVLGSVAWTGDSTADSLWKFYNDLVAIPFVLGAMIWGSLYTLPVVNPITMGICSAIGKPGFACLGLGIVFSVFLGAMILLTPIIWLVLKRR